MLPKSGWERVRDNGERGAFRLESGFRYSDSRCAWIEFTVEADPPILPALYACKHATPFACIDTTYYACIGTALSACIAAKEN